MNFIKQILYDYLLGNKYFNLSGSINPYNFQPDQSSLTNKQVHLNSVQIYPLIQNSINYSSFSVIFEPLFPIAVKHLSDRKLFIWEE